MRKLKLQMQISLDGFVDVERIGPNWDNEIRHFSINNLKNVDCIALGRNTAEGLIPYWGGAAKNPKDADYKVGKAITNVPKTVFSNKLTTNTWANATIIKGDIVKEIKLLKKRKGKDIIVYGGCTFVSSQIKHGLVDEFYLLVNPVAVGRGNPIFSSIENNFRLKLVKSRSFKCGTVLLCYKI